MQDGCRESTWLPIWHRMVHVSWLLGLFFIKNLLEVGLTQHQETMALRTFTTVDFIYVIMCENPACIEIH